MSAWHINEALSSTRRMLRVLNKLTDDELWEVIELEREGARRDSLLSRLYQEARKRAKLNVIRKEINDGTQTKRSFEQGRT
jgi:hypothetical protein